MGGLALIAAGVGVVSVLAVLLAVLREHRHPAGINRARRQRRRPARDLAGWYQNLRMIKQRGSHEFPLGLIGDSHDQGMREVDGASWGPDDRIMLDGATVSDRDLCGDPEDATGWPTCDDVVLIE